MRTPVRRLSDGALAVLRACLGERSPSLAFAEAVLAQAGHPIGVPRDPAREAAVASTLCALLERVDDGQASATAGDAVASLVGDPELLAAFFQNVDLLYGAAAPEADRIAAWIMAAVEEVGRPARAECAGPDGTEGPGGVDGSRGPA